MIAVEVPLENLAEFIFVKNTNNATIDLSLEGLENGKDFFFFCLDLFCKGLITMFGNGLPQVNIQDLSPEQFHEFRSKFKLAGIDTLLEILPPDTDIGKEELYINTKELYEMDDNLNLKDYKFILKSHESTYVIHFELFHNMVGNCDSIVRV